MYSTIACYVCVLNAGLYICLRSSSFQYVLTFIKWFLSLAAALDRRCVSMMSVTVFIDRVSALSRTDLPVISTTSTQCLAGMCLVMMNVPGILLLWLLGSGHSVVLPAWVVRHINCLALPLDECSRVFLWVKRNVQLERGTTL